MKHLLVVLFILSVSPAWTVCAPASKTGGQLTITRDGRLGNLKQMPSDASHPGLSFERRDYVEHDAIEWQVRLQSPGSGDSPLYKDVKSANFVVTLPADGPVVLHWAKGSHADATDFRPLREPLQEGKPVLVESFGGRSSDGAMPYFNLASATGGLIVALGWSGDWRAAFETVADGQVQVTAGLKRSRFRLHPGERVRLPSVLVMSYSGDWIGGQNQFRRLMLEHFTPTSHERMELMPVAASVHGLIGFNATTEQNLTALAMHLGSLGLPLDTFWLDAGWNEGGFPRGQGNMDADPVRFPNGLRPVGEAVSAAGLRFLAWFEPERAMEGTWLERSRPEWLLAPCGTPPDLRYMEKDSFRLLDLGNTAARNWAVDVVSHSISEGHIDVYRQDFNLYPSFFWQTGESPEEIGLREVRHVSGLYDFLDELVRRHPGLILDNCASGGRRLDFEMMRRCVALWRSDCCWGAKSFPRNVQTMTYGLSFWLPLHGLGANRTDDVSLRSGMGACASYAVNFRDKAIAAALSKHLEHYLAVRTLFAADFYPLTPWSDESDEWLAFQFHDPAKGEGVVQAFCGTGAPREGCLLKLHGLKPDKRYTITDWDHADTPVRLRGSHLMERGLEIGKHGIEGAIVLQYASDSAAGSMSPGREPVH